MVWPFAVGQRFVEAGADTLVVEELTALVDAADVVLVAPWEMAETEAPLLSW